MKSTIEKYKADLNNLIHRGDLLMYGLYNELEEYLKAELKALPKDHRDAIKKFYFKPEYNAWYNESLALIRQLIPERLEDFKQYYKQEKRKEFTYNTYTISDYLIGLVKKNYNDEIVLGTTQVITKFEQQSAILKSLEHRFDSSLYEIRQLLQSDLFDSEIETSKELSKNGFYRAAGAVCGVVLEKHLSEVCESHKVTIKKKSPHISDLNQALKDNDIIDVPLWRKIQHLGDLRNLCDHKKDREPDSEDLSELIRGSEWVIKNLF